jgi:rhodanese-related sulfurtransferase
MHHSRGFLKLTNAARKRVREVSIKDVMAMQENKEDFVLVDVREDREWERGRIRGAVHLGKGILERDVERRIPEKEKQVVLYCRGGFRSLLAAENLRKMGYRKTASMKGGWRAWKKAKGKVVTPRHSGRR